MDTIWNRNPSKSEVTGCCGGDEKTNDQMTKSNTKKNTKKNTVFHNSYKLLL